MSNVKYEVKSLAQNIIKNAKTETDKNYARDILEKIFYADRDMAGIKMSIQTDYWV